MSLLYLLVPMALILGFCFLAGFIFAASRGQFEDLETPAHRMLLPESTPPSETTER
ncbi:MAG: cbb3-type cytochrome oxidase assembly protein CcoS [Bdellovibrionales bacterium]|nr:cbb3-type cytochrome oxidase assembly protein CcoS [Bdellovibrionales bacterium]